MGAPDMAQAGGLGYPNARDGADRAGGPAQGKHLRSRQVDHEGMQVGAVLQRPRHVVGELSRDPAATAGTFLHPGLDAPFDDLEQDVELDAAFAAPCPGAP